MFPWAGHVRAETVEIRVPLQLDTAFLREAMVSQAYTDAGESARVWDDGSGCNHMVLSDPRVATAGGRLRLETRSEARVGTALGSRCLLVVDWAGRLAVHQDVSVEPGGTAVRFEVVDSELPDGGMLGEAFWNVVKDHVHPRLDAVRVDLRPPLNELKAVLPLLMPGEPETVAAIIDSVALGSVDVVDGGCARCSASGSRPPTKRRSPPEPRPRSMPTSSPASRRQRSRGMPSSPSSSSISPRPRPRWRYAATCCSCSSRHATTSCASSAATPRAWVRARCARCSCVPGRASRRSCAG
ncbi:MAG: hypothetical protein M5U09_06800 [Gammaproteobacteria bacterium]|nr:hypothetical protein [Gammaproteobacteria bacterium]